MAKPAKASTIVGRALFLLFLLTLVWAPLPLGSDQPWSWTVLELLVLSIASAWLLALALGAAEMTHTFRRAWPALVLFFALFLLILIQLVPLPASMLAWLSPLAADIHSATQLPNTISLDPSATRAAAMKTLMYGLLFALTLLLVDSWARLRLLGFTLIASGVFQAAYGGLMMLSGLEYGFLVAKEDGTGSVTGTFASANHLAGYLEMCLGIGVGLMLAGMSPRTSANIRESIRRTLDGLLGDQGPVRLSLVIMVIGIVLSKSRMGNVAFFCSLFVAGAIYVILVRRVNRGMIIFFLSIVIIDVIVIGNYFGIDRVAAEIRQGLQLDDAALIGDYRMAAAKNTLQLIRDYPLTGTGAGSFASVYPMYDNGETGSFFWNHAHNDYLQFTAELGLAGFVMLGSIVLLTLRMAILAQARRRNQMMRGMACGSLMAIVAILLHSTVDFNLQIPGNAATFVVVLAMAWLTRWTDRKHGRERSYATR